MGRGDGEDRFLLPQTPRAGGLVQQTIRSLVCIHCRARRRKCDRPDGKIPCTGCITAGIHDCLPCESTRRQPPPPRLLSSPRTPATPSPAASMPNCQPTGHLMIAQEKVCFDARSRLDNSDSKPHKGSSEFARYLCLRGEWVLDHAGSGLTIEPQYRIPVGQTRTIRDAYREEHMINFRQLYSKTAQPSNKRTHVEIKSNEDLVDEDPECSRRILQPHQIMQMASDNSREILLQTNIFVPRKAGIPVSNATLLTRFQLAGQELVGKIKKGRGGRKKTEEAIDVESANTLESSWTFSFALPASSTTTTSFQNSMVDRTSASRRSSPVAIIHHTQRTGGTITPNHPTNCHNSQQRVEVGGLLSQQGDSHYEGQPSLLCCNRIRACHPINDHDHSNLMTLSLRIAGKLSDQTVIGPKSKYGVVWCDFNILFGLAYHNKASGERAINFYGTNDWANGRITEILVQAPETVSFVDAPRVLIECLVRQRHSVDLSCPGHSSHTFTIFEVQWQGQGEAKSREVVRKLCEETGRDFAQSLRKHRIEMLHMHL